MAFNLSEMLGIGGFLGGLYQNQENRNAAAQAQQFSADSFASRYQTTVKDMGKAGLNPMLAYSQGGGSPPTGVSYQAQNPFVSASQGYTSAANLPQQGEALEAGAMRDRATAWKAEVDTQLVKAQTAEIIQRVESDLPKSLRDLQTSQGRAAAEQAENARAQAGLATSNTELNRYKQEVLRSTALQLSSQADLNLQKGMTEAQTRQVMASQVQKILKESELLDFDIKSAEDLGNLGREAGQLKPVIDLILRAMKR